MKKPKREHITQLERDLKNFAHDKLLDWALDVGQSCEIAELPRKLTMTIMVTELFSLGVTILARGAPQMSSEEFARTIAETLDDAREKHRRMERS